MNSVSKKQAAIIRKRNQTYQKIDAERLPICEGCGRGDVVLSHSHLISQADCKAYGLTELIWDEENIRLHCMGFSGCCHEKWESRNLELIKTMNDSEANLNYVSSKSERIYRKIR